MKLFCNLAGTATAAFAISLFSAAPAAAQAPVACWDYTTISDKAGSRFGIRGASDDAILSRAAYYYVNGFRVKLSEPLTGASSAAIKVELRSEADGAEAPVKLTGLLVDLSDVSFPATAKGITYETHASDDKSYMSMNALPLEARFKAGDKTVAFPVKAISDRNSRSAKISIRLGAYPPTSWVQGKKTNFDPKATLPQVQDIHDAWKSAGAMKIEFVEPQSGAVVAMSDPIAYFGGEAETESVRANGRAREMLRGGKCQYLED